MVVYKIAIIYKKSYFIYCNKYLKKVDKIIINF